MMTVPAQIMQVPFATAMLDESADEKQQPVTLVRLANGIWVKAGRVEKRSGTVPMTRAIVGGGNLSTITRLIARGNERVVIADEKVFSYKPNQSAWREMDRAQVLEARWRTVTDGSMSVDNVDLDGGADGIAMAWVAAGSYAFYVYAQLLGSDGNIRISPKLVTTTGRQPKVFLANGSLYVFYIDSVANEIRCQTIDINTGVVSSATTLVPNIQTVNDEVWDACLNGTGFTFIYKNTSNQLQLVTVTSALVVGTPVTVTTSSAIRHAAITYTAGESMFIAYSADFGSSLHDIWTGTRNPSTLASVVGPTITASTYFCLTLALGRSTSTTAMLGYVGRDTSTSLIYNAYTEQIDQSTGAGVAGSERITRNAAFVSKPFSFGTRTYAMVSSMRDPVVAVGASLQTISQNTNFIVDLLPSAGTGGGTTVPHRIAAVIDPRTGQFPTNLKWSAPSKAVIIDGVATLPAYSITEASSTIPRKALKLVTLSRSPADPCHATRVGDALAVVCGPASHYDGRAMFERGFLHAPRVISATPTTGGAMVAGTYLYSFVYEWRDMTGLLHRSPPSILTSVTVASSGLVNFVLETASTCGKMSGETGWNLSDPLNARIIAYRSLVGGKNLYRRVTQLSGGGSILNDPLAESVAFQDGISDASFDSFGLGTKELLYTTGGKLDEVMPPSFISETSHGGRLMGLSGDGRTVWATKVFTENPGIFPGYNEALRIVVDDDMTAIASLDDKLVLFSRDKIRISGGPGPNGAGIGSFGDPAIVQSDVGASSARGVVETPDGVMFYSKDRGIFLLTRALEVVWVGKQVQETLALYPTVLDAQIVPHQSHVRYSITDGTNGVVLVYDYDHRVWSVFDYVTNDGAIVARAPITSSVASDNTLLMTAGAQVLEESAATWLDSGQWVTLDFELSILPSGSVAWQHVRRLQLLGERKTHHDLRVRFAFDHRSTYSQDFAWTAEMVATNNDCPTHRIGSKNGANPKSRALRVRVTDATPTNPGTYPVTTGRGGWFSAVGLEFIPKPGLPRHGARFSKV